MALFQNANYNFIKWRWHALLFSAVVIIAGIVRDLSRWEWLGIVFAISLVWISEAVNTAIEMLCNIVCNNEYHPGVKIIKDISAGAVLLAAITSVVTALIVFLT